MHARSIFLVTAELSGAGRFDMNSLTPQMMMEALVADIHNLARIQDSNGDCRGIADWIDLTLDKDGNIMGIDFMPNYRLDLFGENDGLAGDDETDHVIGPGGSIDLQLLPKSVLSFCISDLKLNGTVNLTALPPLLEKFDISYNKFDGECDLRNIPKTLRSLDMQANNIQCSLIIAHLPRRMREFNCAHTSIEGTMHMEDLPPKIESFNVRRNRLLGTLNLRALPDSINTLNLKNNNFAQEVLVANVDHICAF